MTTTIQADGLMEAGGPVWPADALDGLFTLLGLGVLVVAAGWVMVRRERRTMAALLTAVCGQSGGGQS